MEESEKHKLEGLLKARSQDLRQARRPRTRGPVTDAVGERPAGDGERAPAGEAAGRRCTDCGEVIAARRIRAMPRATRCLGCQRAAERAGAPS